MERRLRNLLILVITGVILRLMLAPITGHPFDIAVSYNVSASILKNPTPEGLPQYLAFIAATPAFFYMMVPISFLYFYLAPLLHVSAVPLDTLPSLVQSAAGWTIAGNSNVLYVTDWLYNLLAKIPFILSDLGSGLLIYHLISRRYEERIALTSTTLWFFNPMLIWVSAVWGMFDSMAVFFVLLSTYFLISRRSYALSAISLAVAIGFKLYPIFIIIPLFYYMLKMDPRRSLKDKLVPIASFCATFAVTFGLSFQYLIPVAGRYLGSSASDASPATDPSLTYGLTYWSAAPFTSISGLSVSYLSVVLLIGLGIGTTLVSIMMLRKRIDYETLLFSELLTTSTIFFSYLRVNEQWFVWLLPSLILLSAAGRIKRKYVILLSVVALLYSWINSLLAAFFLPLALYNEAGFVEQLYSFTVRLVPYRLALMAIFGVSFSLLFALLIVSTNRKLGRTSLDLDRPRVDVPYQEA